MGSFFHSLKVEAIYDGTLHNREKRRQAILEYIEVDYNLTRCHSAIGYLCDCAKKRLLIKKTFTNGVFP